MALEEEAADRHDELADMLDVHNNPEVAATFRKLAHYSRLHAQEIRDHSRGANLPVIAPWDFGWEDMEGPETGDISDVNYLMSTSHALKIAMGNEQRAHDFYFSISAKTARTGMSGRSPPNLPTKKKSTLNCWKNGWRAAPIQTRKQHSTPTPPTCPNNLKTAPHPTQSEKR